MAQEEDRLRLDIRVAREYHLPSRSAAQALIKEGKVKVNNKIIDRSSQSVGSEDYISIDGSELFKEPAEISLSILYEDDDCVVINKPAGILSHSKGAFNPEGTVASWLSAREGIDRSIANNREGIVHRLDRGTSGVMIVAKTPEALNWLQKQFSTRKVKKTYIALVEGKLDPPEAIIDMPIERNPKTPQRFRVGAHGKSAVTEYKTESYIVAGDKVYSLLKLTPITGRTHQLRVHLSHLKHPILGDDFYGGKPADRLYLHALSLELTLPNKERMTFSAGLPKSFTEPVVTR